MDNFLIKLERFSAWVLLVLIVVYIISGYGITKGIIDPVFSRYLHDKLLAIPLFIFFILHVSISSSFALRRWKVFKTSQSANIYALILGLIILIIFLWLFFL
jgi:Ca2+/Na+ antiporter